MTWQMGAAALNVTNLRRSVAFYEDTIGLAVHDEQAGSVTLGAPGGAIPLLRLTEQPNGKRSRGGTGLYHFALLVPSQADLARVLLHFSETRTPLQGLSDHFVSEAIYLADPDGNGIEIYRDRPRTEWTFEGGALNMGTVRMDVDGVLRALDGQDSTWHKLPAATIMGHMHLHVADLTAAKQFYGDLLGFDEMVRFPGAALFMSQDGYHHHLGLNVWRPGAPSPIEADTLGLRWFEMHLGAAKDEALARLAAAGVPLVQHEDGTLLRDPFGNGIVLV